MKRILLLLVFAAISLTGFSQFMYEGGKAIAYVDSFVQRGNRFYITNNGRTSDAYFRTSGDSLFFGDVNGEKNIGAIGTGGSGEMVYPGAGIPLSTGSAWSTSITNNSTNWNTAYGWGNHASAGYVPQTRTITINGTSYDLSANRSWTISGGTAITATQIKDSLETLTGDARLDTSAIKGIDGMQSQINSLSKLQTATIYFLENAASDISGYEQLVTSPLTLTGVTEVVNINNNAVLFDAYATNLGFPNIDTIPAGLWILHAHVNFSAVTGDNYVVFDVLKRSALGVETRLFRDSTADISAIGIIEHELTLVKSAFSFTPTDRLIIKLYARTTGVAKTATLYYSGTTNYAFIEPPFLQGVVSSSGGVKSGDLLQSQGDTTLVLYDSVQVAPQGALYKAGENSEGIFYPRGIGLDTTLIVKSVNDYAINGSSTNNVGVVGYSTNSLGGFFYSINGLGAEIATFYGKSALSVGNGLRYSAQFLGGNGDTTLIGKANLKIVTRTGKKFEADSSGNVNITGEYRVNGVPISGGTTDLTPINERLDSIVAVLNDTISSDSIFTFEYILDKITSTNTIASPWKINFSKLRNTYPTAYTIGSAITLTPDTAGALDQATATIQFLGSGTGSLTFAPPFESANGIDTDTCLNEASHLYTYLLGCMGYGDYRLYTYSLQKDKLAPGAPTTPVQLSPPSSFQATAASQTQINLTWVLPSPNGRNFQIYDSIVGTSSNFTNLLASPIKTATSYNHTGLTNGQQVYYRIRTIGSGTDTLTSSYATANATTSSNAAPVLTAGTFTGTAQDGQTLTGAYGTYSDADGDLAGTHLSAWYRDADNTGYNGSAISGATSLNYTVVTADVGNYLYRTDTPVAATGASPGTPVNTTYSSQVTAIPAPTLSSVSTSTDGLTISLYFSKAMSASPSSTGITFSPTKTISSITRNVGDNTRYDIVVSAAFTSSDVITITVPNALFTAADGGVYAGCTGQAVTNNVTSYILEFQTNKSGTFTFGTTIGAPNYITVDWGDGNITNVNTSNANHVYADATTKTVRVGLGNITISALTTLSLPSQNIIGALDLSDLINLTLLTIHSNTGITQVITPSTTTLTTMTAYGLTGLNTTLDLSANTGLTSVDFQNSSNLTTVVNPTSNLNNITTWNFNNCKLTGAQNLSGMNKLGGTVMFAGNTLATSYTFATSTVLITSFSLNTTGLTSGLNLSMLNLSGNLQLTTATTSACPSITLAATNTNTFTVLYMTNLTVATSLDFSGWTGFTTNLQINGCSALTTLSLPTTSAILSTLYTYNCHALTTLDLSTIANVRGFLWLNGNNLTTLTLPATLTGHFSQILAQNGKLNLTSVDNLLAKVNTYVSANAPTANLAISVNGGTNAAPTGGNSNTDRLNIISVYTTAGRTATIANNL